MIKTLLLLDRDGTLMADVGYPKDPADVTLLPGAAETVARLADSGFVPVVVSNQSGIGRGIITPEQADAVHNQFSKLFTEATGITLPCFYCPHAPHEGCPCRKPKAGLLRRAARALGLEDAPSVMIGDKASDVEAGLAWGAYTVLFQSSARDCTPHTRADTWADIFHSLTHQKLTLTPTAA